ncbi:MAG TPA: amino acid permease [candidate division Zixibacteria bacterium]|jgi:amino acid transporter|nr:amino acid permease [Candidatus Latescibacterota bacterium]MDP7235993.1 amino acid permease [Candidatus Latescibacterota bacterium]HIG46861.1 amino acid permease [candidate division Zixibacteria bacterium]
MSESTTQESGGRFQLETELARDLKLTASTTIIVGGVIGSGIFGSPSGIAQALGSPSLFLMVWVLGGLLSFSGALCLAELGAMMPRSGGMVVYLREAYPPIVAYLYGWTESIFVQPGSLAAIAMICISYLGYFFPAVSLENVVIDIGIQQISTQHLAVYVILILLGTINYVGVRFGGLISNVSTFAKVGALAALVILAATVGGSWDHFSMPSASAGEINLFGALGVAMIGTLFSYNGWYNTNNVAGEVKDPRRTLPLAIIIGLGLCIFVYLAVNWAYLYVMNIDEIAASERIAADVAERLIGPTGGALISLAVMISTFGTINAGMVYIPRITYGMAKEGLFFKQFAYVHPRYRTPSKTIVLLTVLSIFWTILGDFEAIIGAILYVLYIFYILSIIALFILRRKRPDAIRPFKVWGYPITPLFFLLVASGYVISVLLFNFGQSWPGLAVFVVGLPVYWIWFRGKSR